MKRLIVLLASLVFAAPAIAETENQAILQEHIIEYINEISVQALAQETAAEQGFVTAVVGEDRVAAVQMALKPGDYTLVVEALYPVAFPKPGNGLNKEQVAALNGSGTVKILPGETSTAVIALQWKKAGLFTDIRHTIVNTYLDSPGAEFWYISPCDPTFRTKAQITNKLGFLGTILYTQSESPTYKQGFLMEVDIRCPDVGNLFYFSPEDAADLDFEKPTKAFKIDYGELFPNYTQRTLNPSIRDDLYLDELQSGVSIEIDISDLD